MTTRTVKHQKNGTALLDEPIIHEPIIEELVPETQPNDAALVEVEVGERASFVPSVAARSWPPKQTSRTGFACFNAFSSRRISRRRYGNFICS